MSKIKAIENFYNDKHRESDNFIYIQNLEILIKNSIKYIAGNSEFSEEELYEMLNENVEKIEFIDTFSDEQINSQLENHKNKVLIFHRDLLYSVKHTDEIQNSVTCELIRVLSRRKVKQSFFKTLLESGYETVYEKTTSKDEHKGNITFNNAVIEYFSNKTRPYQVKGYMNYNINSNIESPSYSIIINLIRQMMIANGIADEELFSGLFSKDKSDKVIASFDEDLFKEISQKMDEIFILCEEYGMRHGGFTEPATKDAMEVDSRSAILKASTKQNIEEVEKIIIDKILMPKLFGKTKEDKKIILEQYNKFIITKCNKEYFYRKTGYDVEEYIEERSKNANGTNIKNTGNNSSLGEAQTSKSKEDFEIE